MWDFHKTFGGKSLNHENILVVLDKDSELNEIYPLDENNEHHYRESFEFISEPGRDTDLYYLRTKEMDWTTFYKLTGWNLWHRRLGNFHNSLGVAGIAFV